MPRASAVPRHLLPAVVPVVDLESSDDDMYKPSPGRGDAGQGSSPAAQPKDDGSDDDDGDYTVFYRHLGM
ncbi:hypothetical protein QYE76_057343 [Lolium multiflorum]|uniref:Uncharacterized protein n=1 Tax=Lolium multiflorum TaxID=4521 RepID=A0AAD8T3Z7_LOLMU|nr:hypothetical protein QYE76_057343 [Lolium multiflorum]